MFRVPIWFVLLAAIVVAWWLRRLLRPAMLARRAERARREFASRRPALESRFFELASASGKPRGLAWNSCAFADGVLVARDRARGQLVGLVGVTIGFQAIEGGGMEDVEAVGNLRAATAVFTHDGRQWTTAGRAIFNLEPREVLQRYRGMLDPLK